MKSLRKKKKRLKLMKFCLWQSNNDKEIPEVQNNTMATLLVFGGLDSRPRLGGDIIENDLRTGI